MGIIAQDPILLSGTLRLNLDIEGRYSDLELKDALCQVQLIDRVEVPDDSRSDGSSVTMVGSDEESHNKSSGGHTPVNVFEDLDYAVESGGQK